jgi:alkylation response protein AidB-like acyl-CoA dehydrogenase
VKFVPSPEQRDFAASLRELLSAADVPAVARAWAAGDFAPGRKLWRRLADTGLHALGLPEEHGGFGAHPVDLMMAFEELGRAAVPGPFVESVAVLPALLGGTPAAERMADLAGGELVATVAIPPRVPFALDAVAADLILLVDGTAVRTAVVGREPASIDAARRIADVTPAELVAEPVDPARALNLGALATAAQILGAGDALLAKASTYAKQREQFGRPIGQFQAVKHLLADALVGLEFARPLLYAAALALADGAPTLSRDVSAAKVSCTDAAYAAARASLQVHGAIGYTSEYDLVLWLTKVRALVSAWGTQAEHRARVAEALR